MAAKNIIVAIDFFESSEALLDVANSLARSNAAKLHVVYVKEPFGLFDGDCKAEDIPPFADLESLKKALADVLPTDADVSHEQWLLTGDPANSILRLAKQLSSFCCGTTFHLAK
jgi:nucleotide-binding universal stress UspA family protein